jgi:hypothetical protein
VPTEQAPLPPVNLQGSVREMVTRARVVDALVELEWDEEREPPPGAFEQTTDDLGRFSFRGVPVGRWTVRVLGPSHRPLTNTIDVVDGEITETKIWVKVDSLRDNEITVYGQREIQPEVTRRTLTTQEIKRVPGTFGDPVKVVQTLPGAARSPFGTGFLIIRGSNPEDTGVYIDGVRVPIIYHLTGMTSVISPELVESVDYLPGGYGARFGRTTGGTVDVQTKSEFEDLQIVAGADILDAQVYAEANVKGKEGKTHGVAVGARRSYIDAILPAFTANSNLVIKPRYWDYQAKYVPPTPNGRRVSAFIYGFDDVITVSTAKDRAQGADQDTQGDFFTRYNSHRVILSYEERFNDHVALRVMPSFGADNSRFALGDAFVFEGKNLLGQLRLELELSPSKAITITPGFDGLAGRTNFTFQSALDLSSVDNPIGEREPIGFEGGVTVWTPDPWLRFDLRPLNDRTRLLITPSVRWNSIYVGYGGSVTSGNTKPYTRSSFDPRVSTMFEVTEGFTVKASTGLYHQPPQPPELIVPGGTPDLAFERAWNSSLGAKIAPSASVDIEVEGFYRDMSQLIETNPNYVADSDGSIASGAGPFVNAGSGRAYGLEVIARHLPTGRFFGWISYTLSRSERRLSDDDDWTPFDFDQTHIMSAQAGYDLPLNFGVSMQVQYVTGNPESKLNTGVYDVDNAAYNGLRIGPSNGERLPAYFQTSLRFDKTATFKHWELVAYLDLLNVVRGVNPEFTNYAFDYSEFAYVRGLPFIPNLGLEAKVRR